MVAHGSAKKNTAKPEEKPVETPPVVIPMNPPLMLYAVRNSQGRWFRRKGYQGGGETWVEDIGKARIYTKIGPARACVSYFANSSDKYLPPDLVEFRVEAATVLPESLRVKGQKEKKRLRDLENHKRHEEWRLREAKKQLEEAQAEINRIRGKKRDRAAKT
jgi:hypothetical protein